MNTPEAHTHKSFLTLGTIRWTFIFFMIFDLKNPFFDLKHSNFWILSWNFVWVLTMLRETKSILCFRKSDVTLTLFYMVHSMVKNVTFWSVFRGAASGILRYWPDFWYEHSWGPYAQKLPYAWDDPMNFYIFYDFRPQKPLFWPNTLKFLNIELNFCVGAHHDKKNKKGFALQEIWWHFNPILTKNTIFTKCGFWPWKRRFFEKWLGQLFVALVHIYLLPKNQLLEIIFVFGM